VTIVSQLSEILAAVDRARGDNDGRLAGREFALAATAIEDAIMRVNRGFALVGEAGIRTSDVEASLSGTDG